MFSSALCLPVHFCRILATIDSQCFIFVYCFCGLYPARVRDLAAKTIWKLAYKAFLVINHVSAER